MAGVRLEPPPLTLHHNVDNRRLVIRVASHQILVSLGDIAERMDFDLVEFLVFTGVWTANTEHLHKTTGRYAKLLDLAPDSLRRPIGETELMTRLRLPRAVFEPYVERLIGRGVVERVGTGLVVPTAVFTRPEMIDSLTASYENLNRLVETIRGAEGIAEVA